MNIGNASLCLNVKDIQKACTFYLELGFELVEDHLVQGWAILKHRAFYLGLFQGHIKENLLNFRGGHIGELLKEFEVKRVAIEELEAVNPDGSGSFFIRDLDGNLIYFDTTIEELES